MIRGALLLVLSGVVATRVHAGGFGREAPEDLHQERIPGICRPRCWVDPEPLLP
jgi:hypothetical protein